MQPLPLTQLGGGTVDPFANCAVARALLRVAQAARPAAGRGLAASSEESPAWDDSERSARGGRPWRAEAARREEARLEELRAHNESDGALFKMRHDPRVTRAGRWLRRLSLDELPQLVNVVRGDMALVGPRPPLPGEVTTYDEDALRRLAVRPGITGLWQVSGRSDLPWSMTVRLDSRYVDNWSLRLDAWILARTVRAVLSHDGAY